MRAYAPANHLRFLLSENFAGALAPAHRADLEQSGLTSETIRRQKIRSVPLSMLGPLLGRRSIPSGVTSAFVLPFPDPQHGGWLDHVRLKVFPPYRTKRGLVKYLQPKGAGPRVFFPLVTLDAVLHSTEPLLIVEGEKKSLAVAQLGLPVIGIAGIDAWHLAGARTLHPDLDDVGFAGRVVKVVPDADVRTKRAVARAVRQLGDALRAVGAIPTVVQLPEVVA